MGYKITYMHIRYNFRGHVLMDHHFKKKVVNENTDYGENLI